MRIKSFRASRVHGYLDFDVAFFDDLTFLIGINGSGKTTIVRSIYNLISPSFLYLANIDFETMTVSLDHDGTSYVLSARQDAKGLHISTNHTALELSIPRYEVPQNETPSKIRELIVSYYRDQSTYHADHEVYRLLRDLPNPMFLGIERRAQIDTLESRLYRRLYHPGIRRNIFEGALADSLDQASELASHRLRQIQEKEDKLKDDLRNNLVLKAFEYVDFYPFKVSEEYPTRQERSGISNQRTNVNRILISLGLSAEDIERRVDPFFHRLEEILRALPTKGRPESALAGQGGDRKANEAAVNWLFNKWQYDRIQVLARLIDEFVLETRKFYAPIEEFLKTVNGFMKESHKLIEIDRFGMYAQIGNFERRPLSALSSGEQQLLVLLTHLAFNPAAQEANVLIIDEPELSLHVSWQEMFADALLKSNPSIQLILATHSPSIILDRVGNCVELTGVVA